jgi:hypothetical protein
MRRIQVSVHNACNQPVRNTTVAIHIAPLGGQRSDLFGLAPVEVVVPEEGDWQLKIRATATGYYDELATLTYTNKDKRWTTDNPSVRSTTTGRLLTFDVYLGRIRFAPVMQQSDSLPAQRSYNRTAILVDDRNPPFYRTVWQAPAMFRTLKNNVANNLNGTGWDRFNYDEVHVPLDQCGFCASDLQLSPAWHRAVLIIVVLADVSHLPRRSFWMSPPRRKALRIQTHGREKPVLNN